MGPCDDKNFGHAALNLSGKTIRRSTTFLKIRMGSDEPRTHPQLAESNCNLQRDRAQAKDDKEAVNAWRGDDGGNSTQSTSSVLANMLFSSRYRWGHQRHYEPVAVSPNPNMTHTSLDTLQALIKSTQRYTRIRASSATIMSALSSALQCKTSICLGELGCGAIVCSILLCD